MDTSLDTVLNSQILLKQGAAALPYQVTDVMQKKLLKYLDILQKWNQVHNLTAVRNMVEQVRLHIMDSLAIVPFIGREGSIADIGSGAGIPGIIIAIVRPKQQIILVEANQKKSAFLRECQRILQLDNVWICAQRAEQWQNETPLSWIVSRAVSDIDGLITMTQHLGDHTTIWGMMKAYDNEECHLTGFYKSRVQTVLVPYLKASRVWVEVKRVGSQ